MSIHLPQDMSQMVFVLDDYFKAVLSPKSFPDSPQFEVYKPLLDQIFAMFDFLSIPIMINSADEKFVYANTAFLQTMQVSHTEIVQMNCSEIVPAVGINFSLPSNLTQKTVYNETPYNVHSFPFGSIDSAQNCFVHFFEIDKSVNVVSAETRNVFVQTIQAIAQTLEQRDPYTAGHQKRVGQLARAIGQELQLEEQVLEGLEFGGLIHDVGKIQVPSDILSKPGNLRKEELDLIKLHPQSGYEIIKDIKFPWPIANIILQHHERLDGSGYPNKLIANDICFDAKIIAVADVVEAMSSHRPYRAALNIDVTLAEVEKKRNIYFDSDVVNACTKLFRHENFSFTREGSFHENSL